MSYSWQLKLGNSFQRLVNSNKYDQNLMLSIIWDSGQWNPFGMQSSGVRRRRTQKRYTNKAGQPVSLSQSGLASGLRWQNQAYAKRHQKEDMCYVSYFENEWLKVKMIPLNLWYPWHDTPLSASPHQWCRFHLTFDQTKKCPPSVWSAIPSPLHTREIECMIW